MNEEDVELLQEQTLLGVRKKEEGGIGNIISSSVLHADCHLVKKLI